MTDMLGHNNPPPFEAHKANINDLYDEAKGWLDGEKVETQEMADGLSELMNTIRQAAKAAEDSRKEEKEPHLLAGKAVDEKYKPLKKKTDEATAACKEALQPFLIEQERIQREAAEKARKEAEEAERIAQEALRQSQADNLAEREAVDAKLQEAVKARADAEKVAKVKTQAKSTIGRAASLRTRRVAFVRDYSAAARHLWGTDFGQHAFKALIDDLAQKHINTPIDGVEVVEERSVA